VVNINGDPVIERFSTQGTSADLSLECATNRREHDLLGLTLQTANGSVHDNERETSKTLIETIPRGQIRACPLHDALIAGLHGDEEFPPEPSQASGLMPMERYLAEDLAERCALLSLNHSEMGREWARYSGCLCGN
jgi:hypothetical protein